LQDHCCVTKCAFFAGLALVLTFPAVAQETFEPYGGPHIAPGSLGSTRSTASAKPATGAVICGSTDPCVLTGQYDSFRNSQNGNEVKLGGMTNFSQFTTVGFYALDAIDVAPGKTITPIIAQPLYVTNVPVDDTTHNMLLVSTLNDSVYAFDADTGAVLWKRVGSNSLALDCSPTQGQAFTDTQANGEPGIPNLAYYGIVSTPVVDVAPTDPVMYVTVACSTPAMGPSYLWYLNAIDITTGEDLIPGGLEITGDNFVPSNELQRPSLLITHPAGSEGGTETFLYAGFGTGVWELAGGSYSYTGALFAWEIDYPFSIKQLGNPFVTTKRTNGTTNIFPATSPPICKSPTCDDGDNWVGNGGGIWSSGKGIAADPSSNVFVGSGNGPFACGYTGTFPTSCTDPEMVQNWGESIMEFPPPTGSTIGSPADWFTPYAYSYPITDPTPAPYQFEELNRFDLDMSLSGVVLFREQASTGQYMTFAATSNKIGQIYVLPPKSSSYGLGQFRPNDIGLTGGSITTQPVFQASRQPNSTSQHVCPIPLAGMQNTYWNCHEIKQIALWNDYLFVWPKFEAPVVYHGALTSTGTSTYNYSFGATPVFEPCPGAGYPGGMMAIAANAKTGATLWALIIPPTPTAGVYQGKMNAYTISTSPSFKLTNAWESSNPYPSTCVAQTAPFPLQNWQLQAMTQPTVANGKVYVPVQQAVSSTGATISGVLVFGNCTPAN